MRALSELQFAFKEAGLEADDLDDTVFELNLKMGEAKDGAEDTARAFDRVGISYNELGQISASDALLRIADGLSDIETNADRADVAGRIFGDDIARRLLPVLSQGSEAFVEAAERANALGVVLDDVAAEKAERFTQQINTLGSVVEGVGNRIAMTALDVISPAIDFVGQRLGILPANAEDSAQGVIDAFESRFAEAAAAGFSLGDAIGSGIEAGVAESAARVDAAISAIITASTTAAGTVANLFELANSGEFSEEELHQIVAATRASNIAADNAERERRFSVRTPYEQGPLDLRAGSLTSIPSGFIPESEQVRGRRLYSGFDPQQAALDRVAAYQRSLNHPGSLTIADIGAFQNERDRATTQVTLTPEQRSRNRQEALAC